MLNVKLSNGYTLELKEGSFGITSHDDKYYVQLIGQGEIKEVEIEQSEYLKLIRSKNG